MISLDFSLVRLILIMIYTCLERPPVLSDLIWFHLYIYETNDNISFLSFSPLEGAPLNMPKEGILFPIGNPILDISARSRCRCP